MLKIRIADTEFEYIDAIETEEFYNGSSRRTLTVTCAHNAISVDALNALLTEPNLAIVTLTNDEMGVEKIHEGYVLKLSCGIQNQLVDAETPDSAAVYEDKLVFKIGRRTYIEQQLVALGVNV